MRNLLITMLLFSLTQLTGVIHQVGSFSGGTSNFNQVFVQNELVYLTDNGWTAPEGLYILDASNPAAPVLRGTAPDLGRAYDVEVFGQRAYMAVGMDGFMVFDVSDPSAPTLITRIDDTGPCERLTIGGNKLYVIYDYGFRIFDISNPLPQLLSYCADYDVYDLKIEHDLAYVTGSNPCLRILNVANPNALQTMGTFNGFYSSKSLSKQGDLLYLTDEFNNHCLLNVADPSAPFQTYEFDDMWLKCNGIRNGHLFVVLDQPGTGSKLLKVFNLANPAQPALVSSCVLPTTVHSLYISGNYLYVTVSIYGMLIYDISDVSNPALISTSHIPSDAIQMELRNNYAYIADADSRLIQVNISDPSNPGLVSQYSLSHPFMDMQMVADTLYVSTSVAGLSVFRIAEDPQPLQNNFQLLGSLPLQSYPRDLLVEDDYVYIANDQYLTIVDASDPAEMQIITQFSDPAMYGYLILAKYQNYLYVGSFGEPLGIIDVSDVHNPLLMGTLGSSAVTASLEVKGHYLFQTGYDLPILIYDIINPLQPLYVGYIPSVSDQNLLFIHDNWLFASYLVANSVKCFDISNPLNPVQEWNYVWGLPTWDLEHRDGLLYTCNREFGFSIINTRLLTPVDDPEASPPAERLFSSFPNPFSTSSTIRFELDAASSIRLDVYNLRGQLLRKLYRGSRGPGEHRIDFDGRDDSGRALPSGVYLIKATRENQHEFLRVVLIK